MHWGEGADFPRVDEAPEDWRVGTLSPGLGTSTAALEALWSELTFFSPVPWVP